MSLPILKETAQIITQLQDSSQFILNAEIKDKYKTFTRFNYREAYHQARQAKKKKNQSGNVGQMDIGAALKNFLLQSLLDTKGKDKKKAKANPFDQLPGVKSERRERFKRAQSIFQIIKHYIEKQGFKPSQQQLYLMTTLAETKEISQHQSLDDLLKKLYKVMNQAVDLNEMRFLCLLILLVANICSWHKDYNRAFYYYNQAKLFSTYAQLNQIKTEALINMGIIANDIKQYQESILFFKKALQYSWKAKNNEAELAIYDHIGNAYYNQGNIRQSNYYHKRFTQGEYEQNESAVKRISTQMLQQYENHVSSLQKKNLTSLFLEYIKLPLVNPQTIAPKTLKNSLYENYGQDRQSPRKNKQSIIPQYQDFPNIHTQIINIFKEDYEFITEIPNPDVQRNFISTQKFGRPRKDLSFEQSSEYHKILKSQIKQIEIKPMQVSSFEKRVEQALSARSNNDWWTEIKDKISKSHIQNVGQLRDKVFNSHQSYAKYQIERRKSNSLKSEKIKQSFNRTLLDWIDPAK